MSWKEVVVDPDERKVFEALDAPATTWRTISAVARQTGLAATRVSEILDKYNLRLTRRADVQSISGQPLVGLIEKVGA
jgi:O-succinylbenzoate synthase